MIISATDCGHPLRDGPCLMDDGHRGRHTTVVYYCDGCGKTRRSRPVAHARNPWDGVIEAQFCFMCAVVQPREMEPNV